MTRERTSAVSNVLAFADPAAQDAAQTGGKGANLAALTAKGFPVPPGFVITTAAYDSFIEQSGLNDPIAALLGEADYDDAAAFEQTTARIRSAIVEAPLPPSWPRTSPRATGSCPMTATWRCGPRERPRT